MGCCFFASLITGLPRLALIIIWLATNWYSSFESSLLAFIGWLCLPYTSMVWMYIYFNNAGHIQGGYLILFIVGILLDIGANTASTQSNK